MKIAVTTTREKDDKLIQKAINLSEKFEIPYINRENTSIANTIKKEKYDYLIVVERNKIVIKDENTELFWHPNMSELKIKSLKKGIKEPLIEATNINAGDSILDCTLGLAGDSILFSYIVGKVGIVVGTEINKYLAFLSEDGLKHYTNVSDDTKQSMKRIKVINESYADFLKKQNDNSFDVVYFDPMFSAPNKKSSSINSFRTFAEHKGLTKEILNEAIRVCKKRVVIKDRQGSNNFESLGINSYYGSKKSGAIIYGIIEK